MNSATGKHTLSDTQNATEAEPRFTPLHPHRRLIIITTGLLICAISLGFLQVWGWELPFLSTTLTVFTGLVFLLCVIDGILIYAVPLPRVTRECASSVALFSKTQISLKLHNPHQQRLTMDLNETMSQALQCSEFPLRQSLASQEKLTIEYTVAPKQRGDALLGPLYLRMQSPLCLWRIQRSIPIYNTLKVFPNFHSISRYVLLAAENQTSQMGIRKLQRRGQGQDFYQLREYRQGDSLRQVDWNASAKRRNLISKEYQDERDQQLIFLLDCGRRMRSKDGELNHFDHALNAMLLVSYVALRQGDAVGLLCFSGGNRMVPPSKGPQTVNLLLNTVYDLHASTLASDYNAGALELLKKVHKRALVVVLSNLKDDANEDLLPALKLLRKKHLVVVANLREQIIDDNLDQEIVNFDQALGYVSTYNFQQHRLQTLEKLRSLGILTLDTNASNLAHSLVNRYLEIKRSSTL